MPTIYLFYLIDDNISHSQDYPACRKELVQPYKHKETVLYGWTTSSKIRKRFKQERSKKKFIEVIKECDIGSELDTFSKTYAGMALTDTNLTFRDSIDGIYQSSKVTLLATNDELSVILDNWEEWIIHEVGRLDSFMGELGSNLFSKELRKALRSLGYDDYCSSALCPNEGIPFTLPWSMDSTMMYIKTFINTYKEGDKE